MHKHQLQRDVCDHRNGRALYRITGGCSASCTAPDIIRPATNPLGVTDCAHSHFFGKRSYIESEEQDLFTDSGSNIIREKVLTKYLFDRWHLDLNYGKQYA